MCYNGQNYYDEVKGMKTTEVPIELYAKSGVYHFQWDPTNGLVVLPEPTEGLTQYILNNIVPLFPEDVLIVEIDERMYELRINKKNDTIQGVLKDVTNYIQQLNEYKSLAFTDPLTGIPNRLGFERYFQTIDDVEGVLFFIDLDNFKVLNDIYGHDTGDRLLQNIAISIQKTLPEGGFLCRVAGDEFLVYLQGVCGTEIHEWAKRILNAVRMANDQSVIDDATVTGSLGIALYPEHATTIDQLLRKADHAMYIAKKNEKGSCLMWSKDVECQYHQVIQQHDLLYQAMKNNEFQFAYEPIVNLKANRIVAFEVWPFWEHPTEGLLHYEKFLRTVYEEGLIFQFEEWMLQEVMKELQRLNELGLHIMMTVNISPKHLANRDFHKMVRKLLDHYQIDPGQLGIEMIEFIILEEIHIVNRNFIKLREMGVKIIIDGFGINHSTISILDELEIDYIKINKHFIKTIGIQESSDIIVSSIIKIAEKHGKVCLAEGIQNHQQIDFILDYNCIYGQGPSIIEPKYHDDLVTLLKHWNYNKIINNRVIINDKPSNSDESSK